MNDPAHRLDRIAGVLLGTAVGDALGLPREGLSRRRGLRIFGGPPLQHRFVFRRGMISDDTEHLCMTAQAMLRAPDDASAFTRSLAWRLRWWLLGIPAGTGFATLRAILKLWLGFAPESSGVWSAGNGPAMRAPILGACLSDRPDQLRAYVHASTRLTHTDPKAEHGALLVAHAARHGILQGNQAGDFFATIRTQIPDLDPELNDLLGKLAAHLERNACATELADALGLSRGVTGYMYHTVPLALYCWLRHRDDFRSAVEEVIALGGDTDSTAVLVGALAGATLGANAIPREWLDGLLEWPRSIAWMRILAARLAELFPADGPGKAEGPIPLFWPGLIPRNLFFLVVVLLHGFRRLLPPY